MKNSIIKSILSFIIMSVLCLFTATPVFAAESCMLNVIYKYNEVAFEGVSVRIYKIAEFDGSGLAPLDDFKALSIDATELESSAYVRSLEDEIENIIENSALTPDYSAKTSSNGEVRFYSIGYGLYYIASSSYAENSSKYFFSDSAFLINPKTIESGSSVMEIKPKATIDTSVDKNMTTMNETTKQTETAETSTAVKTTETVSADGKEQSEKSRLPQTGLQLNYIIMMITGGALLVFIGARVKKNES